MSKNQSSVCDLYESIMRLTWLDAALMLGVVIPHTLSLTVSSDDCLSTTNICMSDLCSAEKTVHSSFCEENVEGCQMKGSLVCNLSVHSVLELFPSFRGCVCEQEGDLCDSIPALDAQCHQKPAAQQQKSSENDWQSSTLKDYVHDSAGTCLESIGVCVSDAVCNRLMAPVLQKCMGPHCDHNECQQATVSFYRGMPLSVAQMLVMCTCQASDESCLRMRTALHSGTCGTERRLCLHTVKQCVQDRHCRELLSIFQSKCFRSVDPQCLSDLQSDECFSQMNPALILGADSECQTAFIDTVGTALHYPCTCNELLSPDLRICDMIHEVFNNRTLFVKHWMGSSAPTEPPDRSKDVLFDLNDYLLSGLACVLLVGIVPLAVSIIIWIARRRKKNKLHQRDNSVIL